MNQSESSKLVRRLVIGVWTFSLVSVALWLRLLIGQQPGSDMLLSAVTASAIAAGLSALLLGISVAVLRAPLSANIISSIVASLAICAWTGYWWWMIDRLFSGTGPWL
jgi:hypothetical protein